MGAPKAKGQSLWVTGYLPASVAGTGTQELTVTANGQELPTVEISAVNQPLSLQVTLPETLVGAQEMSLRFEFSRVIGERGRDHALIVRRLQVR